MNKPAGSLTPRETEVLTLAMQGHSAQEIGDTLSLSRRTVQFHVLNVHGKLGTKNVVQAVAKAIRLKLVPCYCQHEQTE